MNPPRIESIGEKKLIGKRIAMNLNQDRTPELWRSFMPQRKSILNKVGNDLFCLQVYNTSTDYKDITPDTLFEKWAAVEVSGFDLVPDGMEPYTLSGGLYAVFNYKGLSNDFRPMFHFIFQKWLPESNYEVDARTHFDLLGEKYKNNDPSSEEEIWVPIKEKQIPE